MVFFITHIKELGFTRTLRTIIRTPLVNFLTVRVQSHLNTNRDVTMTIWITKNRGSMKGSAISICYDYRNELIQDNWIAKLNVEVSKVLPTQLFLVGIVNFNEVGLLADQEIGGLPKPL